MYIATGLLMRPELCETKNETETKQMLWDRDQKLGDQDRNQSS